MKRLALLIAVALGLTACDSNPERLLGVDALQEAQVAPNVATQRAQTTIQRFTVPVERFVFSPCNDEVVRITGEVQIIVQETVDARGGVHFTFILVPRHARGEGLESGIQYRAVGGDRLSANVGGDGTPVTTTLVAQTRLISPGGTSNFHFLLVSHLTINANGELTVAFDHLREECTGRR